MRRVVLPLLIVLLLAVAGVGVVQYNENQRLQAELAALGKERDGLRKLLAERQKQPIVAAKLSESPAEPAVAPVEDARAAAGAAAPTAAVAQRGRPDGGRFNAMLNSPEVQHLMAIQQKAALDDRYAGLFKRLNLAPADLEKFKNLLVEKQSVVMDTMAAAREQGLGGRDNRDEIRQLVQTAQAEVDDSIRSTLGESVYAQYKTYEQTLPQRGVVNQLSQRLSYSTTPLTDSQADQLTQILAATSPTNNGGGRNPMMGLVASFPGGAAVTSMMGGGVKITDEAVVQAQGVLSSQQVGALQALQQEQQASAALREQMRAGREGGRRGDAAPVTTTPSKTN